MMDKKKMDTLENFIIMGLIQNIMKNVEWMSRGPSNHNANRHQLFATRNSFVFNVPSENITITTGTIQRKNEASLTNLEKQKYINGIETLIANGNYSKFVSYHADMSHNMHGGMSQLGAIRFLGWHRVFLFELEMMLTANDPDCFIPYWDWTSNRDIPSWIKDFKPTIEVDGNRISVTRSPGTVVSQLPTSQDVSNVNNETTYINFTHRRESVHNTVHSWVGGIMNDIMYSPSDPIFWLHHSNIDRIWSIWQKQNPNEHANLTNQNAIFDPWTYTETDTRDIANFHYEYV
jgi:tyrosinase